MQSSYKQRLTRAGTTYQYYDIKQRDGAAKGTLLLVIRAMLAESYERIHRSNLAGMGVLPLECKEKTSITTYNLEENEQFSLDIPTKLEPRMKLSLEAITTDNKNISILGICRINS